MLRPRIIGGRKHTWVSVRCRPLTVAKVLVGGARCVVCDWRCYRGDGGGYDWVGRSNLLASIDGLSFASLVNDSMKVASNDEYTYRWVRCGWRVCSAPLPAGGSGSGSSSLGSLAGDMFCNACSDLFWCLNRFVLHNFATSREGVASAGFVLSCVLPVLLTDLLLKLELQLLWKADRTDDLKIGIFAAFKGVWDSFELLFVNLQHVDANAASRIQLLPAVGTPQVLLPHVFLKNQLIVKIFLAVVANRPFKKLLQRRHFRRHLGESGPPGACNSLWGRKRISKELKSDGMHTLRTRQKTVDEGQSGIWWQSEWRE